MLKKEEVLKALDKLNFSYVKNIYFHKDAGDLCKGDGLCYMCYAKCFSNIKLGNWDLIKKIILNMGKYAKIWIEGKIEDLYKKAQDKKFKKALEYYF